MKVLRTLAKITSAALVICLVFALAACDLFKGSLKLESFTVDRTSVKTVYFIGEEIDFSEIRATVKYSDSTLNADYTYEDLTITYDADITATVGTKTVKVSFMDKHLDVEQSTEVQITVKEDPSAPKHSGYAVDFSGMKTTYFVGDTVDFTGIKIFEKFTNGGADVEMTDLSKVTYDYNETVTATAGSKSILVSYNGEDAGAITITVKKPAITTLTLDTTNVTLEYLVGDTVSFDGLAANVTYENGTSAVVTDITFVTNVTTLTAEYGTKQVTVTVNDTTSGTTPNASFEVKVDGVVDYDVDITGMTLTYLEGETVSFAGIVVTANYYYGTTANVAFEDLTFVHEDNLSATVGNKTVTVKVGDVTAGNFIVAIGDIPTASANTTGVDLSYRVGETVSLDGLTVTLTFSDGNNPETIALANLEVVTDLATLTATAGKKDVQVKYLFDEYYVYAQFQITVYGVDSYIIDATGMKTTYIVGDTLDYTGLVVKAHYLDGGEDVVIDASKLSFTDTGITATAGEKNIPVLVDGKAANVSINVNVEQNSITNKVVGGSFDQNYETGDTLNLSGLTVTLTYKNGTTVTLTEGFTFSTVDMSTPGKKTITVTFKDTVNNVDETVTVEITVVKRDFAVSLEKPDTLSQFDSSNSTEGKKAYGEAGFSSQFINGGMTYVIGDDNTFKLQPTLYYKDANDDEKETYVFYADVNIWVDNGNGYVLLDKSGSGVNYTYTLGGKTLVTVNTHEGEYQFEEPIEKVKISVLPSSDYYKNVESITPVVLEAKVIDAYNVYEAWQLAVIDNYTGRSDWDNFKYKNGLTGFNPAGIILHNDIKLTYKHVPDSFFYHYGEGEIEYYNTITGETKIYKDTAGMNYLIDETFVYHRVGTSDFSIEGNFFNINLDDFPLIASNSIFGKDSGKGYGGDYSNAALFMFESITTEWVETAPATVGKVTINNMSLKGNAGRDSWTIHKINGDEKTEHTELVTAGGLIMLKSKKYANVTLNNVLNNSFFISYFPDAQGTLIVNDSKCYDSYQNGAFVWADATFNLNNTYINGTGGPVIIAMSVERNDRYWDPTTNIVGGKLETHVAGEEVWFKAVHADTMVTPMKALSASLQAATLGSFVDGNGNMNIKAVLMQEADESSMQTGLSDVEIQGAVLTDGFGIDRFRESDYWSKIYGLTHPLAGINMLKNNAAFLTVYYNGQAYTLWTDGTNLYDLNFNQFSLESVQNGTHYAHYVAFTQADEIVLHQGGLSILFDFYH